MFLDTEVERGPDTNQWVTSIPHSFQ
jgi:hypothetical protein